MTKHLDNHQKETNRLGDANVESPRLSHQARRAACLPRGLSSVTPLCVASGSGAELTDVHGRTYIDFAGGIGTCNVGHCAPPVVAAIREQSDRLIHACAHVALYPPYLDLVERLIDISPGSFPKKAMLVNSGAEAVENAVKIARAYTERAGIVCVEGAFHGRTLLGLSLTSRVSPYKQGFGPFCPEVHRIPYAYCYRCPYDRSFPSCHVYCANALERLFVTHVSAREIAALVIEPQLGEGGFVAPPPGYLERLREICEQHGILFIADEVQTGFGRTGALFAVEHSGVVPDLTLMAKSLAGGLPLGAVVGRADVMDAPSTGGLGSTFGGNPIACATALAVIDLVATGAFLDRARTIGRRISSHFSELQAAYPLIGDVRGMGAMIAMELVADPRTKAPVPEVTRTLVKACYERGLVILPAGVFGNVLRALPPLTITDSQLERAFAVLDEAFSVVARRI